MKDLPQTVQLKGRSPVCVRIWICNAEPDEKFFLQTRQICLLVEEGEPVTNKVNSVNILQDYGKLGYQKSK